MMELALGLYMLANFSFYVVHFRLVFSVFLLLYAVGFLVIGWCSRPEVSRRMAATPDTLSVPVPVRPE